MVKVFITIDTEIWCDGWSNIDKKFPDAFRKYIYGSTRQGNYGLPFQLKILNEYNLKALFFVEPLFSLRFGKQPLADITSLIQSNNQKIELHLHPEWIDEAKTPIFNRSIKKTPYLRSLSLEEQIHLIQLGKELFYNVGLHELSAFRAGSYAADKNTLRALAINNIFSDTSYNPASDAGVADIASEIRLVQPTNLEKVTIYPVTTFSDKILKNYRPLQITACSTSEIEFVLKHAYKENWDSVVIVSHSFELLTPDKSKPNNTVVKRFIKLCDFLATNRDKYQSCNNMNKNTKIFQKQPQIPSSNPIRTLSRMLEQIQV